VEGVEAKLRQVCVNVFEVITIFETRNSIVFLSLNIGTTGHKIGAVYIYNSYMSSA